MAHNSCSDWIVFLFFFQVKFALPTAQVQQQALPQPQFGGFQPIQQQQPTNQFRQPPPPQFRQPEVIQQQQAPPPQFRQPEVIQQQQAPPSQFRPEVNQFVPPPQFRQPVQQPQAFQPLPPPPPPPQPSLFDQALKDLRTNVPAAPQQQLEEEAAPPRPAVQFEEPRPFGREPVVLAVDRPAFLEVDRPVPAAPVEIPIVVKEATTTPEPTTVPPTTTTTTAAPVVTTSSPSKRRPSSLSSDGISAQLPDFQNARRQQLNRQNSNRQKINRPSSSSSSVPASPSSFERRPSSASFGPENAAGEISFGQKIRPKVKTNALVSPPSPVVARTTSAPLVADSQTRFEADPPLDERDEAFQTLESQNSGPSQRGRVRFSRPDGVSANANAIPAEVKTTAPTTAAPTTAPSTSSGRGRLRATSTAATTTAVPTTIPPSTTEAPTTTTVQQLEVTAAEKVALTTTTEPSPAEEDEEEEAEEEEQQPAAPQPPVTTTTARNNINDKPWSPYEAIQRQRQTSDTDKQRQATPADESSSSGSGKPTRTRGQTTFATSANRPSKPVRLERPVVLRPLARQPTTSSPVIVRQKDSGFRVPEDFIAPVAPEFGIRGDIRPSINPVQQSLVPVGRRVPEVRPVAGQVVRISSGRQPAVVVVDTPPSSEKPDTNEFDGAEEEEEEEEAEEETAAEEPEEEEKEGEQSGDEGSSTTTDSAIATPTTEVPSSTETPTTTTDSPAAVEQEVEKASGNKLDDPSSVLGVSTATEVSLMYELCYRGRCVRVHE